MNLDDFISYGLIPGELHILPTDEANPGVHDFEAVCPCDPEIRIFGQNHFVVNHKSITL